MKKILLVDDCKEICELVAATLDTDEYTVFTANNGRDAIAMAKEKKPDVIIMDLQMPGALNGIEATRIIKSHRETHDCAVIILSGMRERAKIEESLTVGAVDYMTKPFSPLQLIAKVEELLGMNT